MSNDRRAWVRKLRRPGAALALAGLLALLACISLAIYFRPEAKPVSATDCQELGEAAVKREVPADRRGVLRIDSVAPAQLAIGDNLCLVVAGVASSILVDAEVVETEMADNALEVARRDLDTVLRENRPPAEKAAAREVFVQAASDLRVAQDAQATQDAPTELVVYLNNMPAPFTVMARTTHEPQWLYVPLAAPDNATAEGADFWRKLVSNVAFMDISQWGRQKVVVGLSRAASASAVPEATSHKRVPAVGDVAQPESGVRGAATAAEKDPKGAEEARQASGFEIYVYSYLPFVVGLLSLALFSAAFYVFAARTPLLRDNDLRVRDIFPGPLRSARDTLRTAVSTAAGARETLAGNPTDAALVKARDDAVAAETSVRAEVDRLKNVLNRIDREMVLKEAALDAAKAWEEALAGSAETRTKLGGLKAEAATERQVGLVKAIEAWLDPPKELQDALLKEAQYEAKKAIETPTEKAQRGVATQEVERLAALAEARQDLAAVPAGVQGQPDPKRERANTVINAVEGKLAALRKGALAVTTTCGETNPAEAQEGLDAVMNRSGDRAVGTYSLGRTQMAFWLFVVIAGYIYIAMSIGHVFGIINENILALLGITSATGLGSVLINRDAYAQNTTRGYLDDVLSTNGSPQLQRIQALAWTLILGAVFIWITIGQYRFPEIDSTLLLLMGLVSGFYLGFKLQEPEVAAQGSGAAQPAQ